jgi:hypothetical protein
MKSERPNGDPVPRHLREHPNPLGIVLTRQINASAKRIATRMPFVWPRWKEIQMDTTTLLIIVLLILLLGGGGWYGRGRWY